MSNVNEELKRKKHAGYSLRINESEASRCSGTKTVDSYRTEFMRDRDRVLYSKAFRRLAGKAQVYNSGVDDHKRTRLTHTLEVSQIARAIADPLKLDVDLVEAIALGHDLGHTPFGHAGERTLHEIMTPHKTYILNQRCPIGPGKDAAYPEFYGFKHNLQGLVVAMKLEKNYGELGLDLTNYTLYGIQGHSGGCYKAGRIVNHDLMGYYDAYLEQGCMTAGGKDAWSLESLLVAEADEIAQCHHDVEDALLGGLISRREILGIIDDCFREFDPFGKLSAQEREMLKHPMDYDLGKFIAMISRVIVNLLVTRLTVTAAYHINRICAEQQVKNSNFRAFREAHDPDEADIAMIFSYSYTAEEKEDKNGFAKRKKKFQGVIPQRVHASYDIQKADAKGKYIIQKIFQAYYATPQQLPDRCVFELLSECHILAGKEYRVIREKRWEMDETTQRKTYNPEDERCLREDYCGKDEATLRKNAREHGIGSVRQSFSNMFANREKTTDVEELILMRVICNHIAGMTDSYAQKTYEELYG